jgi:hypothetical protein
MPLKVLHMSKIVNRNHSYVTIIPTLEQYFKFNKKKVLIFDILKMMDYRTHKTLTNLKQCMNFSNKKVSTYKLLNEKVHISVVCTA